MKTISILLIFISSVSGIYAQKIPCKSKVKANKNMVLLFHDIGIGHNLWFSNGMEIHAFADSAVIKKDGVYLTGFPIKNQQIIGKTVSKYYPDGKLKSVDSLTNTHKWLRSTYYENFTGWAFYTRSYYPSGILKSILYYQMNGEDSLKRNWYPNGILHQIIWYLPSRFDSASYTYSPEGILENINKPSEKHDYYPNGLLKASTVDTVIAEHLVTCKKTYHPIGTVSSEEYYFYQIPCLDWHYYTEQGVLKKTVKKAPLSQLPIKYGTGVVGIEAPYPIFTSVEQSPEFPGGMGNLAKYLNEKLLYTACESSLPLKDMYDVIFIVNHDGSVTFKELNGENSMAISMPIESIINRMPKWKPGKQNGKPISTSFRLQLQLRAKN